MKSFAIGPIDSEANQKRNESTEESLNGEQINGRQVLTEEQLDEFIRIEELAASEGNNADIDSKYTPQIGMEFKDRNDAHHFF